MTSNQKHRVCGRKRRLRKRSLRKRGLVERSLVERSLRMRRTRRESFRTNCTTWNHLAMKRLSQSERSGSEIQVVKRKGTLGMQTSTRVFSMKSASAQSWKIRVFYGKVFRVSEIPGFRAIHGGCRVQLRFKRAWMPKKHPRIVE